MKTNRRTFFGKLAALAAGVVALPFTRRAYATGGVLPWRVPSTLAYRQWLEQQTPAVRRAVLGTHHVVHNVPNAVAFKDSQCVLVTGEVDLATEGVACGRKGCRCDMPLERALNAPAFRRVRFHKRKLGVLGPRHEA